MATIASAVNTPFTPAATPFHIQVTGAGTAYVQTRATAGSPWANITAALGPGAGTGAAILQNPVTGVQYQFVAASGTPVVLASQ